MDFPRTVDVDGPTLPGRTAAGVEDAHRTFFSSREFVEIWARCVGNGRQYVPVAVPVRGSGPERTMYGVRASAGWSPRSVLLGPAGFHASPGWFGELEPDTVRGVLRELTGLGTREFVWNVRFDQEALAKGLTAFGVPARRVTTHVLPLDGGHDRVFARYNATTRNQVRKAERRGVVVRNADGAGDLSRYYGIHLGRVEEKGGYSFLFPLEFLAELIGMRDVTRFIVGECGGRIVAGAVFVRDGASVFYLHGAFEREYSDRFPAYAVMDAGVRWACSAGAVALNLGGSGGIPSLEQFKAFWGARPESGWAFAWTNPLWARVAWWRRAVRRRAGLDG